jgi:hypothetical protein
MVCIVHAYYIKYRQNTNVRKAKEYNCRSIRDYAYIRFMTFDILRVLNTIRVTGSSGRSGI